MEGDETKKDEKQENESESLADYLRDQFTLSATSMAQSEAKKNGMEISQPFLDCLADLSFRYTEQVAKDVAQFASHAGRKTVRMQDVIISAHRNEQLSTVLRTFSKDVNGKQPLTLRKRKRSINKIISSGTNSQMETEN